MGAAPRSPMRPPVSMSKRERDSITTVVIAGFAILIGAVVGLGIWAAIPDEPDVIRITTPVCAPAGG